MEKLVMDAVYIVLQRYYAENGKLPKGAYDLVTLGARQAVVDFGIRVAGSKLQCAALIDASRNTVAKVAKSTSRRAVKPKPYVLKPCEKAFALAKARALFKEIIN